MVVACVVATPSAERAFRREGIGGAKRPGIEIAPFRDEGSKLGFGPAKGAGIETAASPRDLAYRHSRNTTQKAGELWPRETRTRSVKGVPGPAECEQGGAAWAPSDGICGPKRLRKIDGPPPRTPSSSVPEENRVVQSTRLSCIPQLHSPGFSEITLQRHVPPQLQKYSPLPFRLTRLSGCPHSQLVGSFSSMEHLHPSLQVQRSDTSSSILTKWPHCIGFPQTHSPAFALTVLHLHSGPQAQK